MPDSPPFTILFVDDNEVLRQAFLLLLQNEGYRVLEAGTGGEALGLACAADLVVLDVGLPDLNGFEVCQRLKADPAMDLVPVILLSGHFTRSEDKAEGLAGGGDVYLTKPIDHRELLGQIKALLRIRRAELLLRASEERYRLIVETAAEGIQVVAVDGRTTFVNGRMAHLLGHPIESLLGRRLFEFLEEESRAPTEALLAGRQEVSEQQELHFRRRDGSDFWALVTASPHRHLAAGDPGILLMVTDVTERRRLEEQLREAQKMEAIGKLAGGISHEYNNLLTVINGFSQVILGTLHEHDPARVFLTEIIKAGERAASLTRQLLSFSRKQMVQPRVLDLNAFLTSLEKTLASLLGENIHLEMKLAPESARVLADPSHLEQALIHLADNSRDAMPQGGRFTLTTRNVVLKANDAPDRADVPPGPYALLSVADTGHGMDEKTLARLFEPFFSTKGIGQGTGLGLASVYGSVKQARGHIGVASAVGVGTTFDIYLPLIQSEPGEGKLSSSGSQGPGRQETVLLVEDDEGVRGLTRHLLVAQGYAVLDANSGSTALEVVARHNGPLTLLVTDVVMPGMSGPQLARQLQESYPGLKILYLSGYTEEGVLAHGILEREANFLGKPFTQEAFARKVRAVLDSKG